jgi:hypothetical protein
VFLLYGGEGGIRTLGTIAGTPVFKTGTFNHSVTSPYIIVQQIFKVMGLSGTVFGKPAIEIKNFNHAEFNSPPGE